MTQTAEYAIQRAGTPTRFRALKAYGLTARILLGWLDHGEHFARLLADLDAENFAEAQASIKGPRLIWDRYTARELTELGDARLPLCWEALLKHAHDWPPPKLGTFTWMLRTTRHPRSIDVVLAFVAETSSAALAEYALRALLPGNDPAVLARELQAARERAGWRIHVLDAVIGELESPA